MMAEGVRNNSDESNRLWPGSGWTVDPRCFIRASAPSLPIKSIVQKRLTTHATPAYTTR